MTEAEKAVYTALAANGLPWADDTEAVAKLAVIISDLAVFNEKINVTAVTELRAAAAVHIADSLTVSRFLPEGTLMIDIGCGGGFPSLPLAAVRPDLSVTSLDSREKKLLFIKEEKEKLGLSGITTLAGRAEELGHTDRRALYGAAVCRAVAKLPVLCEYALPLLCEGGVLLAMKGRLEGDELADGERAAALLGGDTPEVFRFTLACGGERAERAIVSIRKLKPTPEKYPRAGGIISKNPL